MENKGHFISFILVAILLPSVTPCWYDSDSTYSLFWDLNADSCGSYADNGKIVGGDGVSSTYTWPWLGYLERNGAYICTVELISWEWAAVSATCVDNGVLATQLQVTFGRANRDWSSSVSQVKGVKEIIIHENFNTIGGYSNNDIALLHLKSRVSYDLWVRPVCMQYPTSSYDAFYSNCWVAGWGNLETDGETSLQLQDLKVTLKSNTDCQSMRDAGNPNLIPITDDHICALPIESGAGTCKGDGGGPLMCKSPLHNNKWTLLGITSFFTGGCGNTAYADVFTRVSSFSQWITDKIDGNGGPY